MSETPEVTDPKASSKKKDAKKNQPSALPEPKAAEEASTETDQGQQEQPASDHSASPQPSQPQPQKGGGRLIATVALLVAIGTLAAGYQVAKQTSDTLASVSGRLDTTEQRLSDIDSAVKSALSTAESANSAAQASQSTLEQLQSQDQTLQAAIDQINAKLSSVESSGASEKAAIEQQLSAFEQQLSSLRQQMQTLTQTPDASKLDWLLAEVRHLIKMANHQALLERNPLAAAAALESANKRLSEIDDPSLLQVRKVITDTIVALRGVARPDIDNTALTLSSLEKQVESLPLKSTRPVVPSGAEGETGSDAEVSSLEGFFDKVWSDIKSLVVIRESGETTAPALLPPGQQFFLQQNLRLKLEAARLALLQHDSKTFQASIATAREWIERYFDTSATSTANMLTTLSPYENMELMPAIPDAAAALKALDDWQSKHAQTNAAIETGHEGEVS